jgi:sugar phosphate isomerase/epimerase
VRLACGDNAFPLLPHEVAIDLIAQMGFEGFDLSVTSNGTHLRPDMIMADISGSAERLQDRVRGRGLEFADIMCLIAPDFKTMAVNSPDPAERERGAGYFRGMLELAARVGSSGLTMIPGVDWPDEDHAESLERAGRELGKRAQEARERGVRFSIEPHVGSVCQAPEDVLALCEMAPGLELTLDYTHFTVQGYDVTDVDPLLKCARHVHARGATRDRLQASLKQSIIDYEHVVDALIVRDYSEFVAIEYLWIEWAHLNEIDVVSETVLLRDRLRARAAGQPWQYPDPGGVREKPIGSDGVP